MTATPDHSYIGRFAPSPTGPLHFGSLVAALASYLDAHAHGGRWLVRMEDLDPPREIPGAADSILASLQAHGLLWDGDVLYQSARGAAYRQALEQLDASHLVYPCVCSRKAIAAAGGIYPGTCRAARAEGPALKQLANGREPMAVRLRTSELPDPLAALEAPVTFDDLIFGTQRVDLGQEVGDFVVLRKDGYFAYQLAVVVDDMAQGITHVIRGGDLLASTAQQIFLFRLLGAPAPAYGHIPLAVDVNGQKLSKQQGARPLDNRAAADNLLMALRFLGQQVDVSRGAGCSEILAAATVHWDLDRVPRCEGLAVDDRSQSGHGR